MAEEGVGLGVEKHGFYQQPDQFLALFPYLFNDGLYSYRTSVQCNDSPKNLIFEFDPKIFSYKGGVGGREGARENKDKRE